MSARRKHCKKSKFYQKDELPYVIMAYIGRDVLLLAVIFVPSWFCPYEDRLLGVGIGGLAYSAYWVAGYLFKWRHFYCVLQNVAHQHMTPFKVDWRKIKKSDIYGFSAIFSVLSIVCIIVWAVA